MNSRIRFIEAPRHYGALFIVALWCMMLPLNHAQAGEGVFLLGNDTLQLGRASSGVASPRSSYWCYMNPATMVDLERRFDVNWYTVFPRVELEPRGLLGNRLDGTLVSDKTAYIASSGFIWPLKQGTLGGGIFGSSVICGKE